MQVVAVDWSGRCRGETRHIWMASATYGVLADVEAGRTREEVAAELIELRAVDHEIVVGFDFSFSLPAWFLDRRGCTTAPGLWDLAAREGETWLRECAWPFWGKPGHAKPELPAHFRATEAALATRRGIPPKSTFQIGGAGAVGTGSIRGFPVLARLRQAGFAVWPFDAPTRLPTVVEIYPRILTGMVVKSSRAARAAYVDRLGAAIPAAFRDLVVASDDAFDAAVSAIVMSRHAHELQTLPPIAHELAMREGWIWSPDWPGLTQRSAASAPVSRAIDVRTAGSSTDVIAAARL